MSLKGNRAENRKPSFRGIRILKQMNHPIFLQGVPGPGSTCPTKFCNHPSTPHCFVSCPKPQHFRSSEVLILILTCGGRSNGPLHGMTIQGNHQKDHFPLAGNSYPGSFGVRREYCFQPHISVKRDGSPSRFPRLAGLFRRLWGYCAGARVYGRQELWALSHGCPFDR